MIGSTSIAGLGFRCRTGRRQPFPKGEGSEAAPATHCLGTLSVHPAARDQTCIGPCCRAFHGRVSMVLSRLPPSAADLTAAEQAAREHISAWDCSRVLPARYDTRRGHIGCVHRGLGSLTHPRFALSDRSAPGGGTIGGVTPVASYPVALGDLGSGAASAVGSSPGPTWQVVSMAMLGRPVVPWTELIESPFVARVESLAASILRRMVEESQKALAQHWTEAAQARDPWAGCVPPATGASGSNALVLPQQEDEDEEEEAEEARRRQEEGSPRSVLPRDAASVHQRQEEELLEAVDRHLREALTLAADVAGLPAAPEVPSVLGRARLGAAAAGRPSEPADTGASSARAQRLVPFVQRWCGALRTLFPPRP